jgi:hypothetical protein
MRWFDSLLTSAQDGPKRLIWALFGADYGVRFTLAPASATPARSSAAGDCTTWWAWAQP